jgi:hypothetical protein
MRLRSVICLPLLFGLCGYLLADTKTPVAKPAEDSLSRLRLVLHEISCPAKTEDILAKIRSVIRCEWVATRGGKGREFAVYSIGDAGIGNYGVELEHPAHWPAVAKVDALDEKTVTRVRLVFLSESGVMFYCPNLADPDADFPRENGQANQPLQRTPDTAPATSADSDSRRR